MIELGSKVCNSITGLQGIAVGRTQWINGCARITIQPPVGTDGKVPDGYTVDEPNCIVLKPPPIKDNPAIDALPGGPRPEPQRHPTPTR